MRFPESIYRDWETHLPAISELVERGTPWREALARRATQLGLDPHTDLLLDEARGSWLWLIETAGHESALDLQGGVGSLAAAFAYHFRHVHYLDTRPEFTRFVGARFSQDQLATIQLHGAPASPLPFADRSLDCVAVHDLASSLAAWGGRDALTRLLGEVRRVIRPGGCFYLGLDFRSRGSLGAATRSLFQGRVVERALLGAGFQAITRYYAEPNHWLPQAMLPAEHAALRFYERYRRTNFRRARELAAAVGLGALVYPSRIILAAG